MARIALDMLAKKPTKKAALELARETIGGLSEPSKMPWFSYSIPASKCLTGSKLSQLEGTVCSDCYACKGRYAFQNVQAAMERRYDTLSIRLDDWVQNFSAVLNRLADLEDDQNKLFFRWHDSGDLQSTDHLHAIVRIAWKCPLIMFWLPTREYGIVSDYLKKNGEMIPPNLTIRLSTHMVDSLNPPKIGGFVTSSVHSKPEGIPANSAECGAYTRGGKCGDCRLCWDSSVSNVSYPKH